MDEDDLEPRKPKKLFEPLKLEGLSEEDLDEYLVHLRGEIGRADAQLEAKRSMRGAAAAAFKQ